MKQLLVSTALLFLLCAHAGADTLFGKVDDMTGNASVTRTNGTSFSLSTGSQIYANDTISTGPDSEVQIVTEDGAFLAVRPNSAIHIDAYQAEGRPDDRSFLSLLKGGLRAITGWIGATHHSATRITTPAATIGIRGTDHDVTQVAQGAKDPAGTYDMVNDGSTLIQSAQGSLINVPGGFVFVPASGGPPISLKHPPNFMQARHLQLENRIARRKAYLRAHLEQMREDRIRELERLRPDQAADESGAGGAQGAQGSALQSAPWENAMGVFAANTAVALVIAITTAAIIANATPAFTGTSGT